MDEMSRTPHDSNRKRSGYERPGDRWVCGKRCEGTPCDLGPTVNGLCSISDTSLQCRPVPSLRRRRFLISACTFGLALGCCLYLLGSNEPQSISAGPLTSVHSGSDISCDQCHTAMSHDNVLSGFTNATAAADSQLCIDCHGDFTPDPAGVHGLSSDVVNRLSDDHANDLKSTGDHSIDGAASTSVLIKLAASLAADHQADALSCRECHHEHRGSDHDLTAFADSRCQTCHQEQFHSFADGHPEFVDYPYTRPVRIAFDHATHLGRYFPGDATRLSPDADTSQHCSVCHTIDIATGEIAIGTYGAMCADCHDRDIEDRDFPGIPLIALPERSPAGEPIEWLVQPTDPLLPRPLGLLQLLLDGNGSDVTARSEQTAGNYPARIRELFDDVSERGLLALQQRLDGRSKPLASDAIGLVPAMLAARSNWFKHSETDEQNEPISLPRDLPSEAIGGGVYVRNADLSLRYHPIGHADPYLQLWLDTLVSASNESSAIGGQVREMLPILADPTGAGSWSTRGPISSGRCLSCHTVQKNRSGQQFVQWNTRQPMSSDSLLTRFRHAPHVVAKGMESCVECHQLNATHKTAAAILRDVAADSDHHPPISVHRTDFRQLTKSACASCHGQTGQLSRCTTCHVYHAGEAGFDANRGSH